MRNWYMNNTKIVSTCLRERYCENLVETGGYDWNCKWPVKVSAENEDKLVTVFRISQGLSNFDCDVADAIYTIYRLQWPGFNLGNVLRILSGDPEQALTPTNKAAIQQSIQRLRSTHIQIDCAEEMAARGKNARTFYDGPCLRLEALSKDSYRFPTENGKLHADYLMPLYGYAEAVGQMIYFPPELLAVDGIQNYLENIELKRYLIRRLQREKNRRRRHGWHGKPLIISYQQIERPEKGMFVTLGLLSKDCSQGVLRNKRRTVNGYVQCILEHWRSLGCIENFAERYHKRTVSGVEITGEIHDFISADTKNSDENSGVF